MIKQKITAIAICDDCGVRRKEQAHCIGGFWSITDHLREIGWHLPDNDSVLEEPCYCPTCAEVRGLER